MNANELIEFQEDNASEARANGFSDVRFMQTAAMLRQQHAEIEVLRNQLWDLKSEPWGFDRHPAKELTDQLAKYKQVLESIANEHVSHDKIKWQCDDHIRWAKEALK